MKGFAVIGLWLALVSGAQAAWWNEQWAYKKKISLDKVAMQQAGISAGQGAVALVRLHTGNFGYFLDVAEQGKDIRFVAGDDKTPLKYAIEKFDPINEMALIWVKLPDNIASAAEPMFWMYYGNQAAVDGQDNAGIYDVAQVLTYHFGGEAVADATAYGNSPSEATASAASSGVVADAAQFDGQQLIRIPDSPSIKMDSESGWTLSAWVRMDQPLTEAVLFQRGAGQFSLAIKDQSLVVSYLDAQSGPQSFSVDAALQPGSWHQIAVKADASGVGLFVDGALAGSNPVAAGALTGEMTLGADAEGGSGFVGLLDELTIAGAARDDNFIKFAYRMQGMNGSLLNYGNDSSQEDGDDGDVSYMTVTLQNVSVDGWVVIGLLAVMMGISWLVMIGKGIVLVKVRKENANFITEFEQLGVSEMEKLNRPDSEDDEEAVESPLMLSLTGGHEKFQGSSIYRIYHAGVNEINHRLPTAAGADAVMSSQSIDAIRASMDAALVRETQRLNAQMVLLTIAISGGPFLGLLGTVIGVMITFAAIAAQGEVNVNAIAPGVAAALSTTVAGLVVAIPALFGYNYLGSRIKETSADMYVFVDEFIAKLAERYS